MDVFAVVEIVVPALSAASGLVSALAALNTSRKDLNVIAGEATRTGVTAAPGVTAVAVQLAMELAALKSELAATKKH
jgi:hypothetical protein